MGRGGEEGESLIFTRGRKGVPFQVSGSEGLALCCLSKGKVAESVVCWSALEGGRMRMLVYLGYEDV
jgi:hypothetical protein